MIFYFGESRYQDRAFSIGIIPFWSSIAQLHVAKLQWLFGAPLRYHRRGAIEGGLLAYAAYDVGKTAVEVKADLDAGRLDAAASHSGFLNALCEKLDDVGCQLRADASDFGHFLGGRFTQLLNTTEGGQQGVATLGPQPRHFVEDGFA